MAPSPEQTLTLRYTRRHNRIRIAAATAIGKAWDTLAGPDERSAERFATAAAVLSRAAQAETAASLDGYLALLLDAEPFGIDPAAVSGAEVRSGADPFDVYLRSIITVRAALAAHTAFTDAMSQGRTRATSTAQTDVALTQRAAMSQAAEASDIDGYRRVLTGASCAFCAAASEQDYRSGDLMPIHDRCDCGVAPIIGGRDPARSLNAQQVDALTSTSSDEAAARHLIVGEDGDVSLPAIAVHEHGELGPVLGDAGHEFSGPGDIAA